MEDALSIFKELTITPFEISIALTLGVAVYLTTRVIAWYNARPRKKPIKPKLMNDDEVIKWLGELKERDVAQKHPTPPPLPLTSGVQFLGKCNVKEDPVHFIGDKIPENYSPISGCWVTPKPEIDWDRIKIHARQEEPKFLHQGRSAAVTIRLLPPPPKEMFNLEHGNHVEHCVHEINNKKIPCNAFVGGKFVGDSCPLCNTGNKRKKQYHYNVMVVDSLGNYSNPFVLLANESTHKGIQRAIAAIGPNIFDFAKGKNLQITPCDYLDAPWDEKNYAVIVKPYPAAVPKNIRDQRWANVSNLFRVLKYHTPEEMLDEIAKRKKDLTEQQTATITGKEQILRLKKEKLEELKLQVMAQNPGIFGVSAEDVKNKTKQERKTVVKADEEFIKELMSL